ncbi:MAG: hypothetical protein ACRENS_04585 [Candidatus Eiseniibacteriota bacterium]
MNRPSRARSLGFALICSTSLICAVTLLPVAARASAPGSGVAPLSGISLTWSDCPGGATAAADYSYACSGNGDVITLVCSITPSQSISNVLGAELVVDIQSPDSALPDWWQLGGMGSGGCRGGVLATDFDFAGNPGCTDAWNTFGFGGIQEFSVGPPDHPLLSQARIKATAAVTSDHALTLSAGVHYGLIKLVISSAGTVGTPACGGCSTPACLVFNSALLRVLPPASDVTVSNPQAPGSNWATWQGTGANCSAVPVRRSSWGSIKTLYR